MATVPPIRQNSFVCAALLAAVLGAVGPAGICRAQQAVPAKGQLPPDLEVVPRDAAIFAHLRAADLWKSEWLTDLRRLVDRAGQPTLQLFLKKFAPDLSTVDRITFVALTPKSLGELLPNGEPEGMSALLIVRTAKPYDRLRVIENLGPREKVYRRSLYYFNEDLWSGLALIDNQTFVFGSEDALVRFFDGAGNRAADGPLQAALQEATGAHHVVIGLNPQLLAKEQLSSLLPPPVQKLLEARCATFSVDLEKETRLHARFDYAKEDDAKSGEKALRDTLELARAGLAEGIKQGEQQLKMAPERAPLEDLPQNFGILVALGFLREIDTLLKEAPIQRQGTAVVMPIKYKALESSNNMAAAATFGIAFLGSSAKRTFLTVGSSLSGDGKDPSEAHLKKLAEALDKYHKEKGTYPAPAVFDKDGRPLLSWRVALLPYLGEEALYKEFKLDEPWDSLHNKKLLKRLPQSFKAPNTYERYKTSDQVFTGAGTAFPGKNGAKKADVPPAAALLVLVGSDKGVYWSKPADLAYAEDKPLPDLFGKYGFNPVRVLQADGKYRSLPKQELDEKTLRALIKGK